MIFGSFVLRGYLVMWSALKQKLKSIFLELVNLPVAASTSDVNIAWQVISKFLVSKYQRVFWLVLVSAFAATFEGLTMGALGLAVSMFVEGTIPTFSGFPERLGDPLKALLSAHDKNHVFMIVVSSAIVAQVLKSVLLYGSEWIQIGLAYEMRMFLQQKITHHIMELSYGDVTRFPTGKLATYIDQSKLVLDVTVQLGVIVRATLMGLAYLVVMFSMSISLALSTVVVVLILWLALKGGVRYIQSLSTDATAAEIALWRWTVEFLNAPRLLRLINGTERAAKEINDAWARHLEPEKKADLVSAAIPKLLETITVTAAGIFLIATLLVITDNRESSISTLFVYVLVFFRLRPVIKAFNDLRIKVARIVPRLEVVGSLLRIPVKKFSGPTEKRTINQLRTEIRFNNVGFRYPRTTKMVLKDIDFSIPCGSTTAIVGRSGSGKTTIADLLLGLYTPTTGEILVDGQNLLEHDIPSWRSKIGVVDQENYLLNTSVRENIRFGRPLTEATQVEMAARIACASDFVEALEEGYETVIGDRGLRLSGGQQQRLALARAVLSNPEILVMDEATSALDTLSERLIQRALESMRHERTIVVIAHRLSTVANADQILVVEGGEIVEKGTIKELIDLDGQFARMWNSQSSKIEHGTNSHGIK